LTDLRSVTRLGVSPPGIYIYIYLDLVCIPLSSPVGYLFPRYPPLGHPVSPVGMPGVIHRLPPRGTPRGTSPKIHKNISGLLALYTGGWRVPCPALTRLFFSSHRWCSRGAAVPPLSYARRFSPPVSPLSPSRPRCFTLLAKLFGKLALFRPLGLATGDTPEKPFSLSPQDLTYISARFGITGYRPQKTPR